MNLRATSQGGILPRAVLSRGIKTPVGHHGNEMMIKQRLYRHQEQALRRSRPDINFVECSDENMASLQQAEKPRTAPGGSRPRRKIQIDQPDDNNVLAASGDLYAADRKEIAILTNNLSGNNCEAASTNYGSNKTPLRESGVLQKRAQRLASMQWTSVRNQRR